MRLVFGNDTKYAGGLLQGSGVGANGLLSLFLSPRFFPFHGSYGWSLLSFIMVEGSCLPQRKRSSRLFGCAFTIDLGEGGWMTSHLCWHWHGTVLDEEEPGMSSQLCQGLTHFPHDCSEDGDGDDGERNSESTDQFGGYRYENLGFTLV